MYFRCVQYAFFFFLSLLDSLFNCLFMTLSSVLLYFFLTHYFRICALELLLYVFYRSTVENTLLL